LLHLDLHDVIANRFVGGCFHSVYFPSILINDEWIMHKSIALRGDPLDFPADSVELVDYALRRIAKFKKCE